MHLWRCNHIGLATVLIFPAFSSAQAVRHVLVKRADFNACSISLPGSALVINAPILNYTIAAFDPNWFNSNSSQQGAPLFTAFLSSALSPYAHRLTLHVHVWMDTGLGPSGNHMPVEVFDRTTDSLNATQVGRSLTSNEIFALPFQSGGTTFDESSPLYELIVQQHQVPQMNVHIELSLLCGGAPVIEKGMAVSFKYDTPLRYLHTLEALSPGTDAGNARPVLIYTLNPLFQIVSDLFDTADFTHPPGESNMEVFIYEVREGQRPVDVLNGMEFARFFVGDQYPVAYPSGLPPFVPGSIYAWRVRALLRGPESEYRYSNVLYFQVDPRLGGGSEQSPPNVLSDPKTFPGQVRYGDDYVKRVMAALKMILGPNYEGLSLSHLDKIPANGQIRLNGTPYSLEELERLAREFQQSRHSVTRLNFQ